MPMYPHIGDTLWDTKGKLWPAALVLHYWKTELSD
jgi:hypothetical protein